MEADELDGSAAQGKKRKGKYIVIGVIIVIVILILSAFTYIYTLDETKYYTLEEIYELWYFDSFEEGDVINLKDKLTGKFLFNSTYGPVTLLRFKGGSNILLLLGDRYDEFKVGEDVNQQLHVNSWDYNGIKKIMIDELALTEFVMISLSVYVISFVLGISIDSDCSSPGNSNHLFVNSTMGSFSCSFMNLTISQNVNISTLEQRIEPYLDEMDSLCQGISKNGYVTYIDHDLDGNVTKDDEFIINKIGPTKNSRTVDFYMVSIKGMLDAQVLIVNWYDGIFAINLAPIKSEMSWEEDCSGLWSGKEIENTFTKYIYEISEICSEDYIQLEQISLFHNATNIANCTFYLNNNSFSPSDGNVSITYEDKNNNNEIDEGDLFVIEGTKKGGTYRLEFLDANGELLIHFYWEAGIERTKSFSAGHYAYLEFNQTPEYNNITNAINITIDQVIGKQYEKFEYLETSLFQNYSIILKKELQSVDYTLDIDGISITIRYYDEDNNEFLSAGDIISISGCEKGSSYKFELNDVSGYGYDYFCGSVEWKA
jgi:hypothetical protein